MLIALTGLCCSGKNYISDIFKEEGFHIIDVDFISHEIFNESKEGILNIFGTHILTEGKLDRKKVGDIVFSNKDKLLKLEKIIHPRVYDRIYSQIDMNSDIVINIPLLVDRNLVKKCNSIVYVRANIIIRIIRALKRDNYGIWTVLKRIISQKKLNVKQFKSDVDIYFINNSFRKKSARKQVKSFLGKNRG